MKYYLINNDIIKEYKDGGVVVGRTTDEPKWLRDTIDTWKTKHGVGGRFLCSVDGLTSLIIAPENIKNNPNVTEISKKEAQDFINLILPDRIIPPETIPAIMYPNIPDKVLIPEQNIPGHFIESPKIEKIENKYWGFAQNHTGAITTNETWTLANSPHHITGNVTVNDTVNLTVEAGCSILFDGNYSITVTGDLIANGTSSSRITINSNTLATVGGYQGLVFTNADTETSVTYCDIKNAINGLKFTTAFGAAPTFAYISIDGFSLNAILSTAAIATITNMVIKNSVNINNVIQIASGTLTLTDIELDSPGGGIYLTGSNAGAIVTRMLCFGKSSYNAVFNYNANTTGTFSFNTCYFKNHCGGYGTMLISGANATAAKNSATNCIFSGPYIYIGNLISGTMTLTNVDIGPCYSVAKGVDAATLINCAVYGCLGAEIDNFDTTPDGNTQSTETPAQIGVVASISGMRSSRNFTATPTSIIESSLSSNGVTIGWTTSMLTKHRIRYGTVSGTYGMIIEKHNSWSDYLGRGTTEKVTTTPSIALVNLQNGTKYYYVVESWDWVFETWVTSVEGDFTTTAEPKVTQLDLKTDKITYYTTETAQVSATVALDTASTSVTVLVEARKLSDDSLISTLVNTAYSFAANTTVTLITINGGTVVTFAPVTADNYYVKIALSGGSPTVNGDLTSTYGFSSSINKADIVALDVTTNKTSYTINSTVNVDGLIEFVQDEASVTVLVQIKKKSDDSVFQTLLNGVATFSAGVSRTLTNINGSQLTFTPTIAQDYYVSLTVSGGTPPIDSSEEDTVSTSGFSVSTSRILQLDVTTDSVDYGAGDTITITGNIKTDTTITNASVLVEVRESLHGALIEVLLDTVTNLTANTAKALTTINAGTPLTWETTDLNSYFIRLTVNGGTPTINSSYNDTVVENQFVVYAIITVNYPIVVDIPNREIIVTAEVSK